MRKSSLFPTHPGLFLVLLLLAAALRPVYCPPYIAAAPFP